MFSKVAINIILIMINLRYSTFKASWRSYYLNIDLDLLDYTRTEKCSRVYITNRSNLQKWLNHSVQSWTL